RRLGRRPQAAGRENDELLGSRLRFRHGGCLASRRHCRPAEPRRLFCGLDVAGLDPHAAVCDDAAVPPNPPMKTPAFQLGSSLVAMVMIANLQYAWTLFVEPIRAARGWAQSEVQGAFALFILLQTFVQPLDGWLMDRMGPRILISVAGILSGLGWSAMGYASTLTQLYACYAVAGVGAAFVYSGCIGSALKWYPHRRGFAAGVIAAGFGGGSALFNIVVEKYLIPNYGYQNSFVLSGIVQGLVITLVAQVLCHPD